MKWNSNNPNMKLNWAQNQPQEAKGIEPRRSIGGEDICTTTIILLETCALNVEFQHLILSFNKISFMDTIERKVKGWKEAQKQGEDKVNLRIYLMS